MSEVRKLAEDLRGTGAGVRPYVRQALEVTAFKIREDWSDAAARTGLKPYSRSIDYDISEGPFRVVAEIGPNPGKKQGAFGFVEDAPGAVRSEPQHAGRDALEMNEDDFYEGITAAAVDALLDRLA